MKKLNSQYYLNESHRVILGKIVVFFYLGFCVLSLLFPPLFFKKVSFVLFVFSVSAYYLLFGLSTKINLNGIFIFLIFLGYLLLGFDSYNGFSIGFQFVSSVSLLLFIGIFQRVRFDMDRALVILGAILTFFVIYLSASFFDGVLPFDLPFGKQFLDYYIENELGYLGFRQFGSFTPPMFHFVSSPFLLISFLLSVCIYYERNNFIYCFLAIFIFIGVVLSGSRALFFLSIVGLLVVVFHQLSNYKKMIFILFSLVACICITYSLAENDAFSNMFSLQETSNRIKYGHFLSFIQSIRFDSILFGSGLGAEYYSSGVRRYVSQTELMPLDFIRYFGIFITLAIFFTFFFLTVMDLDDGKVKFMVKSSYFDIRFFIFLFYFLMAFTNPVLLSSVGMIVVFWYWSTRYNTVVKT